MTIHFQDLGVLNMQKKIWFVSSFEHVNFATNGTYSKKHYDNPNYCASLVIFQTYKNANLKNLHSFRWFLWLCFCPCFVLLHLQIILSFVSPWLSDLTNMLKESCFWKKTPMPFKTCCKGINMLILCGLCYIIMMWCIKLNQIIKAYIKIYYKSKKNIEMFLKRRVHLSCFGLLILSIVCFHIMHT